jgi:CheY-like chemotaxis protein
MRIESEVGRGSTFTVVLARGASIEAAAQGAQAPEPTTPACVPTSPGAWTPDRPPRAPDGSPGRRGTILHVEDDVGVARSMGLLLSLEGYTVVHAASRAEALRRVEEGLRPDLILCDFHLQQGQTGDQVVGELAEALGRKPPTIVLTGDISDRQIGKARAIADRILPKPVDIEVLLREFDGLLVAVPSAPAPLSLN